MNRLSRQFLPYLTALLVGVLAGTIANSPVVAGLTALVFASIWASFDRRSDSAP